MFMFQMYGKTHSCTSNQLGLQIMPLDTIKEWCLRDKFFFLFSYPMHLLCVMLASVHKSPYAIIQNIKGPLPSYRIYTEYTSQPSYDCIYLLFLHIVSHLCTHLSKNMYVAPSSCAHIYNLRNICMIHVKVCTYP